MGARRSVHPRDVLVCTRSVRVQKSVEATVICSADQAGAERMAYRRSLCGSEPYTDGSQGYLMIDGYDRGVTVADPRDNDLMVSLY